MKKSLLLSISLIPLIIGCEIGDKNRVSDATKNANKNESSVISKALPKKPIDPQKVKKIYTKTGTPGYYIQVGYFSSEPTKEFINRIEYADLPYKILKKYKDGKPRYYALVGPYISYNQASQILGSAREYVTSSAFIVKVEKP
jgi:hypothetical protein